MLKKIISGLLGAVMVFAVSGHAFAALFDDGSLVQTAYTANDKEVGIDLGIDLDTYDFSTAVNDKVATNALNLSQFTTGKTWSDVQLAFWGVTSDDSYGFMATTQSSAPTISTVAYGSFISADTLTRSTYSLKNSNPAVISYSHNNGYIWNFTSKGVIPGSYATMNDDWQDGEKNLSDLSSVGYVDMYLYKFQDGSMDFVYDNDGNIVDFIFYDPTIVQGNGHDYTAVLRLYANGDTVVNPVPLPAAVVLFGSALLGIIGVRRKN